MKTYTHTHTANKSRALHLNKIWISHTQDNLTSLQLYACCTSMEIRYSDGMFTCKKCKQSPWKWRARAEGMPLEIEFSMAHYYEACENWKKKKKLFISLPILNCKLSELWMQFVCARTEQVKNITATSMALLVGSRMGARTSLAQNAIT